MAYPWIKTLHLLMVLGWMASVFYLPRILVNVAEVEGQDAVRARLVLMGRRLYRFGHIMFGLALVLGMVLWLYFERSGAWLHVKLTLVALLLAHFVAAGRLLRRSAAGGPLPSARRLRWFNELPVLLTLAVLYLVLAKPI